ncbi:hypothetical protein RsS62_28110 [Rhizobium dioscoreae]|nr:hypothetical protein RsS62_28110 [Rhizobium dioscoreae]
MLYQACSDQGLINLLACHVDELAVLELPILWWGKGAYIRCESIKETLVDGCRFVKPIVVEVLKADAATVKNSEFGLLDEISIGSGGYSAHTAMSAPGIG